MIKALRTDARLRLSAEQAEQIAALFGTPVYVLDEGHFRERIRAYRRAFEDAFKGAEISFASKANSTLAVLAIAYQEGCNIDVASEGELRAALIAGVPANRCHFHGNNKSLDEIRFALEQGVGQLIIDNFEEIDKLSKLRVGQTEFLVRLAPGVDPKTHHRISTGQEDTKFGFNIADGSAERAVKNCLDAGLNLIGIHCHVGSQLLDPEAQQAGGETLAEFAVQMRKRYGFEARLINVGGGLGVRYLDKDEPTPIKEYCRLIVEAVQGPLKASGLSPKMAQEPGRSLVAESGITLYRVGVVKTVPTKSGAKTYVVVDGGLSDNPRPAMYDSRYTVERTTLHDAPGQRVTVSGKHCETDTLFADIQLPRDIKPGDLLQVLCTGAYNSAMASNYNRYPRPASVLIRENGRFELVQERDSWETMFAREHVPGDLHR